MIKCLTISVLVVAFIFNDALSQENNGKYDSLAISFLRKKEFGEGIGIKRDSLNGKVMIGKNYYCYESFRLKVDDTLSISVINIGAYDSDGKKYIAIIDKKKDKKVVSFLGEKKTRRCFRVVGSLL